MTLPVEVRKEVVPPFAIFQTSIVHVLLTELFIEASETQDMILGPLGGILASRSGLHQERPITGFREQELATHLAKDTIFPFGRFFLCRAGTLCHSTGTSVEVRVDPRIGLIQPDLPEAFVTPARWAGRKDL